MSSKILCGVDIGGTKLAVGLVTEDGRVSSSLILHDHVDKTPDEIVEMIVTAIRRLLREAHLTESDLRGIGVATAGHLRYRDGILITMSNLRGFEGYPLRARIQETFSVPVSVDNDANAQAFGEFKYGAGAGYSPMVFMTISTQIGAGIVLDGRLFRGMTGTSGEIGHTIVDPDSEFVCPCGNRGCLIAVASGVALPGLAKKLLAEGMSSPLVGGSGVDAAAITGELVKQGLDEGDELCSEIVRRFGDYIGIACYNIFQVFNPQAIVLGGGLLSWGDPFFHRIASTFRQLAGKMMYEEVSLLKATIGAHSGLIGAASLVLEAT